MAAIFSLLETIDIFFPLAFAEQALICPINPFESSNLLEFPTCFIYVPTENSLRYDDWVQRTKVVPISYKPNTLP